MHAVHDGTIGACYLWLEGDISITTVRPQNILWYELTQESKHGQHMPKGSLMWWLKNTNIPAVLNKHNTVSPK